MQRALSAQQVYGSAETLVIPIPEVDDIQDRYDKLYTDDFKTTKQYIHVQGKTSITLCLSCYLIQLKSGFEDNLIILLIYISLYTLQGVCKN